MTSRAMSTMGTHGDKYHAFLGFLVLKKHLDQCELVNHLAVDGPGRKEKEKNMKATNHQWASPTHSKAPWVGSLSPSSPHRDRQTDTAGAAGKARPWFSCSNPNLGSIHNPLRTWNEVSRSMPMACRHASQFSIEGTGGLALRTRLETPYQ